MLSPAQPASTIRLAADPAARRGAIAVLGEAAIHFGTFGGRANLASPHFFNRYRDFSKTVHHRVHHRARGTWARRKRDSNADSLTRGKWGRWRGWLEI